MNTNTPKKTAFMFIRLLMTLMSCHYLRKKFVIQSPDVGNLSPMFSVTCHLALKFPFWPAVSPLLPSESPTGTPWNFGRARESEQGEGSRGVF